MFSQLAPLQGLGDRLAPELRRQRHHRAAGVWLRLVRSKGGVRRGPGGCPKVNTYQDNDHAVSFFCRFFLAFGILVFGIHNKWGRAL